MIDENMGKTPAKHKEYIIMASAMVIERTMVSCILDLVLSLKNSLAPTKNVIPDVYGVDMVKWILVASN